MSDWRTWARVVTGLVVAVIVFSVFTNIVGDYRAAKREQLRKAASKPSTGPASLVTKTGRPPLTTPTTSSSGSASTAAKTVIILVDGVNLRARPSTTSAIIRPLRKNERLTYLATSSGFHQVRDKSGNKGWVSSKSDYTRLVPAP